jgi:CBS domain-containing protein
MKRWLYDYDDVHGAPDRLDIVLRQRIHDLVAAIADDGGIDVTAVGDVLVQLPAHVLGTDVHKQIRVHTGVAERRGERTCIPLRWHAEPAEHAFPAFDGTIELEPQARDRSRLTVVGAATLPLGVVGGAVDATMLGSLADRTVEHVAQRMGEALGRAAAGGGEEHAEVDAGVALLVRDVMTPGPLVLHEDMPLKTAALLLFHYDVTGAPVTNEGGGLVGVLSEADLVDVAAPPQAGFGRDADASWRRHEAATVGQACSRPVREIAATASLRDAAAEMRDHDVARLVVVDRSDVVGIVARHDVLAALVRSDADVQAAVDRVLRADEDHGVVVAAVDWGVARLRGRVRFRSEIDDVVNEIRAVDGVLDVDAELSWEVDDLIPPSVPMM